MIAAPSQDWNIFQQIFVEHWDGFKRVHPRYNKPYYDGLVDKMLGCGNPEKMETIASLPGFIMAFEEPVAYRIVWVPTFEQGRQSDAWSGCLSTRSY